MKNRLLPAALAVAALVGLAFPTLASAKVPGEDQLHGRITAFDGKYDLHVQLRNGNVDDVMLHRGTIINPTGLTLRPGMRVTILGNPENGSFAAYEIDTPYHESYVPAVAYAPGFYAPGFYGAGFYGGGFGYGFGYPGPYFGGPFGVGFF